MSVEINKAELELLKKFTIEWVMMYSFMPPECILVLFVYIQRIIESANKINTISIGNAQTVSEFHKQAHAAIVSNMYRSSLR